MENILFPYQLKTNGMYRHLIRVASYDSLQPIGRDLFPWAHFQQM
jgi:hypothetical protein